MKKALLIVNLGTPDSPSYFSVFKYLREFLSDEKVLNINPILRFILVNFIICPFRSFSSSKIYKKVWDKNHGSPLLHNTKILADKLNEKQKNNILDKIPMKRFGKSIEIANLVYFLSSDESAYITGQNIHVNGGMLMV